MIVVEKPRVPAILRRAHDGQFNEDRLESASTTHVGKKLTKPSPKSCEHVMTANMGTLGSLRAIISPPSALHTR